jgi:hypothetical protein
VSTPPATTAPMQNTAPMIHSHKLIRFNRGNATSLAPSIRGRTKFPSAAGMLGMMKRNTITAP